MCVFSEGVKWENRMHQTNLITTNCNCPVLLSLISYDYKYLPADLISSKC